MITMDKNNLLVICWYWEAELYLVSYQTSMMEWILERVCENK